MININEKLKIVTISLIIIIFDICVWAAITSIIKMIGFKLFDNYTINAGCLHIFMLISMYFVVKKYNNGRFSIDFVGMKLKQNSFRQLLIGIGIGMLMFFIWFLILNVTKTVEFKGIGFMFYPINKVFLSIISALMLSISVAFTEEIAFRGIILNQLMQYKGKIFALILSALMFTLCHMEDYNHFYTLLYVFGMGIILGCLYIMTGSLYLSIGLHFAVNFGVFILTFDNSLLVYEAKVSNSLLVLYFNYSQIFTELVMIIVLIFINLKYSYIRRERSFLGKS
jgi:membrane protease YdiL (CAAX protease family)